jgi:hypothetical protein
MDKVAGILDLILNQTLSTFEIETTMFDCIYIIQLIL